MATSIVYPQTLPCPIVMGNDFTGGQTFDRTEFDYAIRQRAKYCSPYMLKLTFLVDGRDVMKAFKNFYYNGLGNGAKSFLATWEVEGDQSEKEFRFSARYRAKAMGGGLYAVSADFEMLTKIKDL